MQRQEHFGRRTQRERLREAAAVPVAPEEPLCAAAEQLDLHAIDTELDRELQDWNERRRLRRRSFREPWRSFSVAAGIALGLGIFILPDSVADIANTVTTGLFAVSVFMGWRKPKD